MSTREYRQAHKEEIRAYQKAYYARNREKMLAKCREYYRRKKMKNKPRKPKPLLPKPKINEAETEKIRAAYLRRCLVLTPEELAEVRRRADARYEERLNYK